MRNRGGFIYGVNMSHFRHPSEIEFLLENDLKSIVTVESLLWLLERNKYLRERVAWLEKSQETQKRAF